jgi:glucose-1-phosphate adenylyltransferase
MSDLSTKKILTILLAGGKGERLYPLTKDRAKPGVPFGGIYRIIDFTLSNCLHSGLRQVEVLTQYKSLSLSRHLKMAWNKFNYEIGEYINDSPPQQRLRQTWYQGTADAVYQNIYTLDRRRPDLALILSGDHIYKMDYRPLIEFHLKKKADVTIGAVEVERSQARDFGVIQKNRDDAVVGFQEKPSDPKPIPGNPDRSLVSMGIYIFNTNTMVRRIIEDAKSDTSHDFGKNVIPAMVRQGDRVFVYSFKEKGGGFAYWRDIGAIDAFWQANLDLLRPDPPLNLNDKNWPIWTYHQHLPPAKIMGGAKIENSMICNGCIVRGGTIINSVLSPGVEVEKGAEVVDSVLMDSVKIGRNAKIRKSILDKRVSVPAGMEIGHDLKADAKNFTVTQSGVCVIPKETPLSSEGESRE